MESRFLRPRRPETAEHVLSTPAKRRSERSRSGGRRCAENVSDKENLQKSPSSAKKRQTPTKDSSTTPSKKMKNVQTNKVFKYDNEEENNKNDQVAKRLRPRVSQTSQQVSTTPEKPQLQRNGNRSAKNADKKPRSLSNSRGRRAPPSHQTFRDDEQSSSSSSSSDDSEEDYAPENKHPNDPNLELSDEDVGDVSDVFAGMSDKENVPTPPSSRKRRSVIRNLSSMTLKENTPARNTRSSMKGMNREDLKSLTDHDDDDESEDENLNDNIKKSKSRSSARRSLKPITQKAKKEVVTPIRLKVTKTPGGTRKFATRSRKPESDNDEEIEARKPIPKLRFKLPASSSIVEKMKELSDRLHLSEVPESLPCRENEENELRKFIEQATHPKNGESSAMYISGVPGTGKTATVRAVINSMKSTHNQKFVYAEVNAMIFRKKVFVEIYNQIEENYSIGSATPKKSAVTCKNIASSTARQKLNTIFRKSDKNRPPIIVLVDELDGLCNRKQDVLYDIFDWTSIPEAKVTIIAIANTLDFPERMLCQRISSRLDKRRLIFQPYEHEQIEQIIQERIRGSEAIDVNAMKLVARKVSAISGDLRQSLDMLRRSIRIAIEQKAPKVTMDHVNAAQKAVAEPLKMRLIKSLKLHKFMLFRSVLTVNQSTDKEETIFEEVYKMYCVLCSALSGVSPVAVCVAYELMLQLARCSLVVLLGGQFGMLRRRIKLGMATYEAEKCVKQVEELRKNL